MPSLISATFAVLTWDTIILVAIIGFTGGLAVAAFLLGRRSSSAAHETPPPSHPDQSPAIDPFLTSASPSRRAAPRRAGRHVDVLISDATQETPPHQGWVIDRSTGGLALGSIHAADIGTILSVRPLDGSETVPWVQVEVRQCSALDHGSWRLGCKFVRPPPYSVMMLFG
jgi:hypothetical protein